MENPSGDKIVGELGDFFPFVLALVNSLRGTCFTGLVGGGRLFRGISRGLIKKYYFLYGFGSTLFICICVKFDWYMNFNSH